MKQYCMSKKFWKVARKFIPHKKSIRRPRKSTKKVMNALFYIIRTGIQWKALPKDFKVSSSTVHRRFQEWIASEVFHKFWCSILEKYQTKNRAMMQWIAIDGSHSKAPLGGNQTGKSPVDRRKIGTKKHTCVDQNGVILGIDVSGANVHDSIKFKKLVKSIPIALDKNVVLAADTAYDSREIRKFCLDKNLIPFIPDNPRRSKNKVRKVSSSLRWIVERTHSHLNNWRGIFIRWNKKVENYIAAIKIAAIFYTLRHL